ncbi:MAG: DUF5010 domain-containing protein [Chloroflexi bacterium]|nr:DUF5010 domain-containing protein [Chloroflexota bacterium]
MGVLLALAACGAPAAGSAGSVNGNARVVASTGSATANPVSTTPAASPAGVATARPPAATALVLQTPTASASQSAAPTATVSAGFNGQSNLVPPGFPTPVTAGERLQPGGPPHDPGPLNWAHPGPYMAPSWTDWNIASFAASQRLVTTYYFYWHDLTDPARRGRFASGQFDAPPDPDHYSFLLPETPMREFGDMLDAGIDFVLPVYWGEPGHPGRTTAETSPHYWSTEGIPPMVAALDRLWAQGKQLRMGMFYDTTILANADLTTPAGKEYFYVNVRDFYSRIPPKYWAAIGGKPIVWLYDTLWIAKFDQSSLDYVSDRFAQDFGGLRPYIVREVQWATSKGVTPEQTLKSDGLYGWGAAANGYNPDPRLTVAEVGPGFKNTAYCTGGPAKNCFDINREGGAFFERGLAAAVAGNHNLLALETWNEFSEGTDIQETVQQGRRYIDLAHAYAAKFKLRT